MDMFQFLYKESKLVYRSKANQKFVKAYNKAIKELKKDGTLAKLSKKYFGEDVFNYVTKQEVSMVSYTPTYVFKFLPTILNALPLTLWVIFLTVSW